MNNPTTSTWKIDPGHTAVQFRAKHLAIASVSGAFDVFAGTVHTDHEDFSDARVEIEIEAASLRTNNAVRDTHLKSDIFFDVQQFPKISFRGILQKTADQYALTGTLTMRDIAKSVTLPATFIGIGEGRGGDTRAGFEATGKLNRTDFGLTWNMLTETDSLIVGENITLQLDVELIKEETGVIAG